MKVPISLQRRISKMTVWTVLITLALIAFISLLHFTGDSNIDANATSRSAASSTRLQKVYNYRSVSTQYDSVAVSCVFGEFCVPRYRGGSDSLPVEWVNDFSTSLDSTESAMNNITQSKPFEITSSTDISFFRMIFMQRQYQNAFYSVPDTTAWTVELWDYSRKIKIATLDSVGICKIVNCPPTTFPDVFGFQSFDTYEMASVFIGNYATAEVDSVYLFLQLRNWDAPRKKVCSIIDDWRVNSKFTDDLGLSKKIQNKLTGKAGDLQTSIFPNPSRLSLVHIKITLPKAQFITVSLYNTNGKKVSSIYSGVRSAGASIFPFHPHDLSAGSYSVRVDDGNGATLTTEKIVFR